MKEGFKFELGDKLKDTLTGFEGTAMARTEYYTGCNQYGLLSPELTKDKKPAEWVWIDEVRLTGDFKTAKKAPGGSFPEAPSA